MQSNHKAARSGTGQQDKCVGSTAVPDCTYAHLMLLPSMPECLCHFGVRKSYNTERSIKQLVVALQTLAAWPAHKQGQSCE
jgi:hypothetical protein